jgi:Rps23 Pro-64 3,4-dihydroxylase Tpa1-like proline 4-hydroxylase
MNSELKEKKYKIIKGFIEKEKAINLAKEFETYCEENNIPDDSQVVGSRAVYNHVPFLEILTQKVSDVSDIIEETVLPTYSYARVYKNGNVLKTHIDRPSCEISLTVHLNGDTEWAIYFENEDRENIILEPGDAVLYLGGEIAHGRDAYEGESYAQCFLHYVRSKGIHSDHYFDTRNQKSLSDSDYIRVYDNIISDDLCELILTEYENGDWCPSKTSDELVKKDVRNCSIMSISTSYEIDKNPKIRKYIDDKLFSCAAKVIQKYSKEFTALEIQNDTGYDILKYDTGEFYTEHVDYYKDAPRIVSCSFALNDDYEGGEFAFFGGKKKVRLKKGSAILFPSNFMFPHQILPVQNGTRYSIITWFK